MLTESLARSVPAAHEASVMASSSVIWTALFAWPILGERLSLGQNGAIALMLGGIALSQWRGRRRD